METENRRELQEKLAHRWLRWNLFVPPIIASEIILEGKSELAKDAMAVANFALCVLDGHKEGRPLYG